MSVSKYAYDPAMCDGDICVGDCDLCDKPKIAQIHNTATTLCLCAEYPKILLDLGDLGKVPQEIIGEVFYYDG